jgi:AraC-like DNA-binding protein
MTNKLRPLAKANHRDPVEWLEETRIEVRRWVAQLGSLGWTMAFIAAEMGCSENSLRDWRDGKVSMPVVKWKALRALAAEHGRKVGT